MIESGPDDVEERLRRLDPADEAYATHFVDVVLSSARRLQASDVHWQPAPDGVEVRWRIDGVLQPVGLFPSGESADVVSRLKVLAGLLTYRNDTPQEGRLQEPADGVEMRLSTFPTLHGERAVVRLFGGSRQLTHLSDLGYPPDVESSLRRLLTETSGVVMVCGPAGSGKTTSIYAMLRELVRLSGGHKSIVSLEDPIEVAVDGVAQSQVNPESGFTLHSGLRSLMRQDPEVMLVGEMRDRETAAAAFQAALTGHLLFTTFHAGAAGEAVSRLSDMGIEPYLLRSGVRAILCQRLVRRLCDCSRPTRSESAKLGLPVQEPREAAGCSACRQSGYRGRLVLAELLVPQSNELGRAILSRSDASQLQQLACESGMTSLATRAVEAVANGQTSPAEVRRVFGVGPLGRSRPRRESS